MVGISQPTVSDLMSRGVITEGATAGVCLREYCANLREMAAGRMAAGDLDLATERARLAREQADKVAMQNSVTRNELAPVYLIEDVLAKAGARAARILDTIPGVIRRREPSISAETIKVIESDIAKVRNICAAISLAQLREEAEADPSESPQEESIEP
jgi:phage terminase Nu1 subunit (DNA packaging protein)